MIFNLEKLKQARDAGIPDDEIWSHTSKSDPRFSKAKEAGLSLDEIATHFSQKEKQPEGVPVMAPDPIRDYNSSAAMVESLAKSRDENYGRYQELSQLPERTPEAISEMVKSFEAGKQAELNLFKEQETMTKLQAQVAEQEQQRKIEEAKKAREQAVAQVPVVEPIVEDVGQLEGIKNAAMNAFDASRQAMAVSGGVTPEEAETISKLEYQKEARKLSPAYSEYLQAEGMDAVKAFAKNPFEITTNIVAEGLAGSLYSLGAGVAAGGVAAAATAATGVGAPLAPAAFLGGQIGGTFAGSLATEYGSKVLEELQNAGMDLRDPESIKKFFSDEKLTEDAKNKALKRGVPVAIFDGVSAGIGGRLARLPVQALTKTPTRLAVTEAVTQAALGGGGEIAGAVAAGEKVQPKAVFAEVLGEAGPATAEITVGRIAERMARTPEQKQLDQNVLATQVATRASQDVAPATADVVERQVQDTLIATAETPDQRVARLQQEAKAAAGITLEEEGGSGLPPVTPAITPTPEIAQAAQARITEREGQAVTPVEAPAGNRIEAAAYQAPDGTVYYGPSHLDAMVKARDAGKIDQATIDAKQETASRETPEFGFATNSDPFVTRDQAETIARQSGQITVEQPATGKLHSNEVSLDAFAQPTTPTVEARPITETRTVADAIRDKDTFIYNDQRGAVSVEDGVTVFRPFGTQERFEIGINPNQTIGEIEGIEWARKGQARTTPIEPKPETSTIIESNPDVTTDEVDQSEPDFEVPAALVEIEKSQTLNDLADLFDTGDSKVVQEGKRARKVSQTPEFYRQATPQQIDLAKQLIDNALRIIDALPISDQQKQDMAEPFLLLDQDINNYENNPEYQRYKATIRTEVRPAGEAGAFPTTETEVAAWIKESEQRAAAEAERIRGPQPILTEEQQKQNEIERIAKEWGTDKETATKVFNNEVFKVPSGLVKTEWTPPSGWFFEKYGNEIYAIPQTVVKNRLAAQGELRRLSRLERAALSGLLTEQKLVNETDAKSYITDAKAQGFTDDDIAAATTEAQAKWNERFGDNGNARQVAGELPPPVVNVAAEEAERATKPRVTGGSALPSSKLFGMTAREALQYLADQNLGASDMEREGRPLNLSQLMQRAASVLAKLPLRILDADFIKRERGGARAYRANEGFIRVPATEGGQPHFVEPETLVHEVGHTLTSDAIRKYVEDRAVRGAKGAVYLRAMDKALADPNTPEQIKRLVSLYKQTIDEMGLTQEYFGAGGLADMDATRSQKSAWRRKKPLINKFTGKKIGWSELYGLANLDEFVAMTWSSPAFQDLLKNIKVKNQPSIYERFVRIIRDLFGFDSDTMAAAVVDASYALAELEAPATGGAVEQRIAATTAARGAAPETGGVVPLAPEAEPVTPQQDRDYLDAVERGDYKTAQRILDSGFPPLPEMSQGLKEEISYWLNASNESGNVMPSWLALKDLMGSWGDRDSVASSFKKELQDIGIKLGYYQTISLEDAKLRASQGLNLGKGYDFKRGDKYYIGDGETPLNIQPTETRDEGGNIIPPSQRFQPEQADIRYAPLPEPTAIVEEYAPRTDEEQKAFNKASTNKILRRNPQLAVAAVRMKNGEITAGQYADLVDAVDPFIPKGADPIPTDEKIKQYMAKTAGGTAKLDKVGLIDENGNPKLESGSEYEFRIDIPTYNESTKAGDTVYAITAHLPVADDAKTIGSVAAFTGIAKVTDPRFMTREMREGGALAIAMGAGKFRLATVKGKYEPITELPIDINDPDSWNEVGYNPVRSSFFVDTRTGQAVVGGSEAIMVGSRVFVKNAQMEARPTGVTMGEVYAPLPEPTGVPTFAEESPEAATLKEMATSMAKVDAASEAKGGKPETQKISDIAANWMDQGGDERALQDAIVENTNLTPANAARVAKAIARQYDIQQSIATAFLETQTGLSVEALPEGVTLPKEVDPDRPKPVMQRLFEVFMGVRVPPVKITGNEKTLLKQQIRLKAAANRAAKEAQKETAAAVIETIKQMELRGPVRPKQAQALAKRAANVIWTSEKSVEAFTEYAAKVVENTNYDADVREAKAAQKRAKELSKQKTVAMSPQRQVLEDIGKISIGSIDDPRLFADTVNYYLRAFKKVTSPDYVVIPDSEMTSYLSQLENQEIDTNAERERVSNERLAAQYGLPVSQVEALLNSQDIIRDLVAYAKREQIESILNQKIGDIQTALKAYDQNQLRPDQRKLVDSLLAIDAKGLDAKEKQSLIRIGNNVIYNNQTNGAQYFVAVANGQQNARQAAQDFKTIEKNRAWIDLIPTLGSKRVAETMRNWSLELQSVADTFRNIFGKESMAKIFRQMGMYNLDRGFTDAANVLDQIQEKMAEFYKKNTKKYGKAARDQNGILSEGVVGFLIQQVPAKGEAESIAQRRDLIKQDIANRRSSRQADKIEMANRIEEILGKVDGNTVEEILANMKANYRPNYDSLTYLMNDLLPQYKDFLKQFDENFNDQANNYDNPYYLPIAFIRSGPELEITPESESMFYEGMSLRPRQAANTIKRVDYSVLPKDKSGNPKEIQFNLRRGTYDSLSDQINKAYTNEAWQQIFSFMKTADADAIFGGRANKDFMAERLNRLRISRMRRGSANNGAIAKFADSVSVLARKIGTGIALGGVFQVFKQSPDQLISALGTTGRYDLLGEHVMTIGSAKKLLDKFSIGRRGDASSGYKYINQMEGAQNRLERAFTESRWSEVKENASKVADVWMLALKKTDFLCAASAWMTYYRANLDKNGIKFEGWDKEAQLVDTDPSRQDAASYAEQMTDIYQGSSDPTKMATFAQSGKSGWENFVKAALVPFNSFAVQQRMRIYSDGRDSFTKAGETGALGRFGLASTIGGLVAFHTMRRLVLPTITGAGVYALYAMLGVDMDEPDEEKKKEEARKTWRQFQGELLANTLVGGAPQFVEAATIDAFNYANYLVSLQLESEDIIDDNGEIMDFAKYQKERSPFWRYQSFKNAPSFGMFDVGFGQAEKVAVQTKQLMDREQMEMYTPEEQRLLYFSTLSEWLYLMRLNDADFARMVGKARRDMIKAVEDREKQLKAIREGR